MLPKGDVITAVLPDASLKSPAARRTFSVAQGALYRKQQAVSTVPRNLSSAVRRRGGEQPIPIDIQALTLPLPDRYQRSSITVGSIISSLPPSYGLRASVRESVALPLIPTSLRSHSHRTSHQGRISPHHPGLLGPFLLPYFHYRLPDSNKPSQDRVQAGTGPRGADQPAATSLTSGPGINATEPGASRSYGGESCTQQRQQIQDRGRQDHDQNWTRRAPDQPGALRA